MQLISDILDLSKIEAGKLSIENTRCSPFELLNDVRWMMEARASDRGLSFEIEFDGPIPEFIESDPTRVRQILINLVGNAIKFTERGGVRLVCRMERAPTNVAARLCISVIDTGIGIPPEQLEHLFQPFAQADSSMTRRFGGTGLGLYISRHLAESLGGMLEVVSQQGTGSRFTLALPVGVLAAARMLDVPPAATDTSKSNLGNNEAAVDGACLANRRVLLAEDGVDNQYLISLHLRSAGMEVDVVGNGRLAVERALEAVRDNRGYDLILMDMQMPELDGYSATARLRREHYEGRIVALTAHAMEVDRKKCLAAGCDEYLSKPVTRDQLLRTVTANLLSKSPSSRTGRDPSVDSEAVTDRDRGVAPLVSTLARDPRMIGPIERFVAHLPERIETLLRAADRRDRPALIRETHRLKGAAGGYGFQSLTEAAATLEDALAQSSDQDEIDLASLHDLVVLCRRAAAPHDEKLPEREDAPHCVGD